MSTLKRVLALSLALMLALSLTAFAATDFSDAEEIDPVNAEAVDMLAALGIIKGYEDGTFRPNGNITRAEAAKMIYVICNGGVDDGAELYKGSNTFSDTREGAWYEGYIEYCYATGIVAGRGTDVTTGKPFFAPEEMVTGYELAKMLLVVAEYDPTVEGFTGENWTTNVMKHARLSELSDGYAVLMSAAAPRQWASLMIANLITEVTVAEYIGDMLVTGTNILRTHNARLVGAVRMGLVIEEGIVMETPTLSFGGGTHTKKDSVIARRILNSQSQYYGTYLKGETAVDLSNTMIIGYDIPNEFLGKEVKIVAKAKNPNLSGNAKMARNNLTVYAVYETGTTVTTDVGMADLGWGLAKVDKSSYNNRMRVTLNGTNYDFKFYADGEKTADSNTPFNGMDFDDFINGVVMGNDYDFGNFSVFTGTADDEDAIVGNAEEVGAWLGYVAGQFGSRNDDVVLYDVNGDGYVDFVHVKETTYHRVSAVNNSYLNVVGMDSIDLEEVNFTDGTPERNDIVAMTENYITGEMIRDIAIVEGEKVTASSWTLDSKGAIHTVKLDGENYGLVNTLLGVSKNLNKSHQLYYKDRGYIVYSTDSAAIGVAPESVAVITNVGSPVKGSFAWTVSVRYLTAAGTTKTATYDIAHDNDAIAGNEAAVLNNTQVSTHADNAADALKAYMVSSQLVKVEETDGGVVFYKVGMKTYADLDWYKDQAIADVNNKPVTGNRATVRYDSTTGLMRIERGENIDPVLAPATFVLAPDAAVFVRYNVKYDNMLVDPDDPKVENPKDMWEFKSASYKRILGADLNSFDSEGRDKPIYGGALVDEDGNIVAVYIDFGRSELPATTDSYLVIAGGHYATGGGVYVPAVLPDGTAVDIKVVNINKKTDTTDMRNELEQRKYRMMQYTVSGGNYTLTDIVDGQTKYSPATTITREEGNRFYAGRTWYSWNEDTVIFYVKGSSVTVSDQLIFEGEKSTFIYHDSDTSLTNQAKYIIINGDGKNVIDNNIRPGNYTADQIPAAWLAQQVNNNNGSVAYENDTLNVAELTAGNYGYVWKRNGVTISGVTGNAYGPVTANDLGKTITVTVSLPGYSTTTFTWVPGVYTASVNEIPGMSVNTVRVAGTDIDMGGTGNLGHLMIGDLFGVKDILGAAASYEWTFQAKGTAAPSAFVLSTSRSITAIADRGLGTYFLKVSVDGYLPYTYTFVVDYLASIANNTLTATLNDITAGIVGVAPSIAFTAPAAPAGVTYNFEWVDGTGATLTDAGTTGTAVIGTVAAGATVTLDTADVLANLGKDIHIELSRTDYYGVITNGAAVTLAPAITGTATKSATGNDVNLNGKTAQNLTFSVDYTAPTNGTTTYTWGINGSGSVTGSNKTATCAADSGVAAGDVVTLTITNDEYNDSIVVTWTIIDQA